MDILKDKVKELQARLRANRKKAVEFAEKNTIRNSKGQIVITSDEWGEDD